MALVESNKTPTQISSTELIDLLNTSHDTNREITAPTDIPTFLSVFELKPGKTRVKVGLLFDLYRNWSSEPTTKMRFVRVVNTYFVTRGGHDRKNPVYLLNKDALKLTDQVYKEITPKAKYHSKNPYFKRHFDNFLNKYNLKPGNTYVEPFILYYLYDSWVYATESKRTLNNVVFGQFLSLYFKSKRLANSRIKWFGVSKNIKNHLSEKTMEEIRQGYYKRHAKKDKK